MHKRASLFLLLATSAVPAIAQSYQPSVGPGVGPGPAYAPAPQGNIAATIARWNSLRQSDGLPFSSYASFMLANRGWPGEAAMRRTAEQRLSREAVSPSDVATYFRAFPPTTPVGRAQFAFALQALGGGSEARDMARNAWISGAMPQPDEQRLLAMFNATFSGADHERRMEVLLGNGDTASAGRMLAWAPAGRRSLYEARLALQTRAPDAQSRGMALDGESQRDPGFLIDKANWLRATGQSAAARQVLASRAPLSAPPANPEAWLETSLTLARAAANDSQWSTVYALASRLEEVYPPGTDVSARPFAERDAYTSLVWLGASAAMYQLRRPQDASRLFVQYGQAARSPQTRAKGFFWAARAASAGGGGGQSPAATAWLEQAAANPDQFYGQLALERLGRPIAPPVASGGASPADRQSFARQPLVEAARYLGMTGNRADQTAFIRAIAVALRSDRDRNLAGEFGREIGRLDLGVWAAREARNTGDSYYARAAFPEVAIPPAYSNIWAFAHGITRQESSFERTAVSSAGARGLMQLMPATARQAAGRVGQPYSLSRLTEDPAYNVQLGSHHLSELMSEWGGSVFLVAAAYNAGSGNVRRWVRERGDPRQSGVDVLRWIEEIPFAETRNYVQRVLENMVVYDTIDPNRRGEPDRYRLSRYLGLPRPN